MPFLWVRLSSTKFLDGFDSGGVPIGPIPPKPSLVKSITMMAAAESISRIRTVTSWKSSPAPMAAADGIHELRNEKPKAVTTPKSRESTIAASMRADPLVATLAAVSALAVIDGDTFRIGAERYRLLGIDAAEIHHSSRRSARSARSL